MSTNLPADIAALPFEEAMAELEKIVRLLEDGKIKLDDAISAYERGATLRRHLEQQLKHAEMRVEQIMANADGISTTPFNPGA